MGHVHIVEYLLQTAHADITHADTDGWTALHNASAKGYLYSKFHFVYNRHVEIVQLLLASARANINAQSRSTGYTPLSILLDLI
jgi:ankyrin repeat protein